jgi:hypothetical protein
MILQSLCGGAHASRSSCYIRCNLILRRPVNSERCEAAIPRINQAAIRSRRACLQGYWSKVLGAKSAPILLRRRMVFAAIRRNLFSAFTRWRNCLLRRALTARLKDFIENSVQILARQLKFSKLSRPIIYVGLNDFHDATEGWATILFHALPRVSGSSSS